LLSCIIPAKGPGKPFYDFVIAQAREIVERQRREEVEDNDIQSDGELSLRRVVFDMY
jgi:hypothetical protein